MTRVNRPKVANCIGRLRNMNIGLMNVLTMPSHRSYKGRSSAVDVYGGCGHREINTISSASALINHYQPTRHRAMGAIIVVTCHLNAKPPIE